MLGFSNIQKNTYLCRGLGSLSGTRIHQEFLDGQKH